MLKDAAPAVLACACSWEVWWESDRVSAVVRLERGMQLLYRGRRDGLFSRGLSPVDSAINGNLKLENEIDVMKSMRNALRC